MSLFTRRALRDGADLDTTAQLIPEPTNPFDRNAVGCWVQGRLIGYLPREEAPASPSDSRNSCAPGRIPTTNAHIWAVEYDDYDFDDRGGETMRTVYRISARVALSEPELLAPINLPPPKPRAQLPDGGAAKVTGSQDYLANLLSLLGDRATAWAYGSLEPYTGITARTSKTLVQVSINGRPVGNLSPQTSAAFLPVVAPLDAANCRAVVRVLLKGSPVSVAATVYAARAHEIPRKWFDDVGTQVRIDFGPT